MCLYCVLIVVYKSSIENETVESEVQTMTAESDHTSTQTDSSEWMQSVDTQANSCEWSLVSGTQTDQSEWLHSEATQIDAGFASDDGITQTDWQGWLHSANLQTDSSYWQSSVSAQTEVKQISSSAAQTTEMRVGQTFADVANETLSNLATQVTIHCMCVSSFSSGWSVKMPVTWIAKCNFSQITCVLCMTVDFVDASFVENDLGKDLK